MFGRLIGRTECFLGGGGALHVSQTCQSQQYQQTAKGNLWNWGIHSTTRNGESRFAMASDEYVT